jgi:hypothetical protein
MLTNRMRPMDSAFRSIPSRLRGDSATVIADSILLSVQIELDQKVRDVVATFDDSVFQAVTWPEGFHGQQLRLAQGRPSERGSAEEEMVADSIRSVLANHGIWSYIAEGDGYVALSVEALRDSANRFVTDAARGALHIELIEQTSPVGGDAAVRIPWDSLGDRLAMVDSFLVRHPDAPARAAIQSLRAQYLTAFLTGWENTNVFNSVTNELRPDVRASYERFRQRYGTSESGRVVGEYLALLEKTHYRRTAEVERFLRSQFRSAHS